MRAAVLHGPGDLRVEDVPNPAPGPGEVRVRVEVALTCGTDLKVFRRGYHARMLRPPCRFGHEFAGTVDAVGPDAGDWRVGDRVVAANSAPCGICPPCRRGQENLCDDLLFLNGAYAASVVVPARIVARNLLRIPSGVGTADAALAEPLGCVVLGLDDLALRAGERLLVVGSGPIGLLALAAARAAGVEVTVAGRGALRLDRARRLGASAVHESADPDGVPDAVRGAGFDAVLEATGRPGVWEAAVDCVRKGGRVNFFGGCPAGTTVTLDTGRWHYEALTLRASFHHTPSTIRRALALIADGVVRAGDFVDGSVSLEALPGHFHDAAAGRRAVKVRVEVGAG